MAESLRIVSELKSLLALRFEDKLRQVILFGSHAYGGAKEFSDYDVLIILKEKPDWKLKREISDLCYEIDLKYDVFIDAHILGEEELNTLRGKQPIFQKALKKGIYA